MSNPKDAAYPRRAWVAECVQMYLEINADDRRLDLDLSTTLIRVLSDWHGYLNGTVDRDQVAGSLRDAEIIMQGMMCSVLVDAVREAENEKLVEGSDKQAKVK